MAKDRPEPTSTDDDDDARRIGGGPGASDSESGGGNATGTPDADTGMRTGDLTERGDVEADREKLFPDAKPEGRHPGADAEPADPKADAGRDQQ